MQAVQLRLQKEKESRRENVTANEQDSDILALLSRSLPRGRAMGVADDCLNTLKQIGQTLTRFKLSRNEVRVYLFLARYGSQKVQQIAENIGIHRTEAYKILSSLETQGLTTRILDKPMRFSALPLERVLENLIDERRKRITQLELRKRELLGMWSSLPKVEGLLSDKEMLQVIEGRHQVIAKVSELLRGSESEFQAVVSDKEMIWLFNNFFFEEIADLVKERALDVRMMTQYSQTSTYIIEKIDECDMDFAFLRKSNQPSFFVADNRQALLLMNHDENKLVGMWTNYGAIVASFRNLFDQLWKNQTK